MSYRSPTSRYHTWSPFSTVQLPPLVQKQKCSYLCVRLLQCSSKFSIQRRAALNLHKVVMAGLPIYSGPCQSMSIYRTLNLCLIIYMWSGSIVTSKQLHLSPAHYFSVTTQCCCCPFLSLGVKTHENSIVHGEGLSDARESLGIQHEMSEGGGGGL